MIFRKCWYVLCILSFITSCEQADVGEGAADIPEIDKLVREGLSSSSYTGAVFLAGTEDEILYRKAYGFATLYDQDLMVVNEPDSISSGHLFDLASLTKIFATTYGLMALCSDGLVELDEPVMKYLPKFDTERHSSITIRHLLSHTSGLVRWFPTYYVADSPDERTDWLVEQPLLANPGTQRNYSDLGYMILADLIEEVSGQTLDRFLAERIYNRVDLSTTGFYPEPSPSLNYVSTSHGNPFERKMVYDPSFGYEIDLDPDSWNQWREYTLTGEVNDGNAYHTHSGVAGHAGLFSTADDLAVLLQLVMNSGNYKGDEVLSEGVIEEFMTEDEFGNGLGWGMTPATLNAENLPDRSVGHTGFTGTNFILNRDENLFYIFLTNRQHAGVDESGNYPVLKEYRSKLADLVFNNSFPEGENLTH